MTNNEKGLMWALLAAALFAVVAAMAKEAVSDFHVLQILFFRQLVVFTSALPVISKNFPQSLKTQHPWLHSARLTGAFVALSMSIWAVALLPLSTAITLSFAHVFLVALLAWYFLGEQLNGQRLAVVVAGFVGVLVVLRPGGDGIVQIYALVPLLGALGAAVAKISVRRLSQTESTATLLVYQAVFVGVLAAVPLFWFWVTPSFGELLFLLAMGSVATLGQWVGVKALRLGEAGVLANVEYSALVYAVIFGYVFFEEIPDTYTLLGALIIVLSAIYLLRLERRGKTDRT